MKIAFLLPTIDFGRDGIADYVARLAGFCESVGHEIRLIPLGRNDWVRNRAALAQSVAAAELVIRDFSPDILSWQFDGRIFHPLALFPTLVVPNFSGLAKRIHLMAHETWEGDEQGASLKRRTKGSIQQYAVIRAMRKMAPDFSHASNRLYLHHLQSAGFKSSLLPLFSSVPVMGGDDDARQDYGEDKLNLVIFGGFRDHWDSTELLLKLRETGKKLTFHHVGRNSEPEGLVQFRERCQGWAEVVEHGEQAPGQISRLFLNCHFAISTYNLLHLRKSSIYATFLDHGLPVIVPRQDSMASRITGFETEVPEGVILLSDLPEAISTRKRMPVGDSLKLRGIQFLRDIAP